MESVTQLECVDDIGCLDWFGIFVYDESRWEIRCGPQDLIVNIDVFMLVALYNNVMCRNSINSSIIKNTNIHSIYGPLHLNLIQSAQPFIIDIYGFAPIENN